MKHATPSCSGYTSIEEGLQAMNAVAMAPSELKIGSALLVWENMDGDDKYYPCTVIEMDGK